MTGSFQRSLRDRKDLQKITPSLLLLRNAKRYRRETSRYESAGIRGSKMYKVIHLVKRKSHLTHEQFREHFERSHAAMALKFCGHLFSEIAATM